MDYHSSATVTKTAVETVDFSNPLTPAMMIHREAVLAVIHSGMNPDEINGLFQIRLMLMNALADHEYHPAKNELEKFISMINKRLEL